MRNVYHQNDLRKWHEEGGRTFLVIPLAYYEGYEGRRALVWVLGQLDNYGMPGSEAAPVIKPGVHHMATGALYGIAETERTHEDFLRLTGERDREMAEKARKEQREQEEKDAG